MEYTYEEARDYLQIDKDGLDDACAGQALLFEGIALKVSEYKSLTDEAKENTSALYSTMDLEIRKANAQYKVKTTEKDVEAKVRSHEDYRDSVNAYQKLKHEYEKWSGLMEAYKQRVTMLKTMADLFITGYFTSSSIQSSEKVREALKSR